MSDHIVKHDDTRADVKKDYGGYVDARKIRQRNRRILVLRTAAGTFSIHIKTLVQIGGERKIMRTSVHLSGEVLAGIVSACADMEREITSAEGKVQP